MDHHNKGYPPQTYPTQNYPPQGYGYGQQAPPSYDTKPDQKYNQTGSQQPLGSGPSQNMNMESSGAKYQDWWASALFVAHLIAFVVLSYFGIQFIASGGANTQPANSTSSRNSTAPTAPPFTTAEKNGLITALAVGAVVAAAMSAGYVFLMKRFGQQLIKISLMFQVALLLLSAVFMVLLGAWVFAFINLLFAGLTALFYYWSRHRIPLASLIMGTVCEITSKYPATYGTAVTTILLNLVYWIYWSIATVGVITKWQNSAGANLLWIYCVFSGYWVGQVFNNTLHVTISGVTASYYFLEGTSMMPQNPTAASAKRALTTSFGSICFGSLIIALIRTMRAMLREAIRRGSIMAVIANCILGCIESLVEYFNSYAYVHVAIYGKSFCEAAKDTWRLVKTSGISAIINDSLVGSVLSMGSFLVGLTSAAISYGIGILILRASGSADSSVATSFLVIIAFVVLMLGFMMFGVVTMVIESGTQTTFVCLAEDPGALARTKPELYNQFKQVYPQIAWRV